MNKYLRERLSVVITLLLGTSSGFGMAAFLDTPEIRIWLISLAMAISLLVSLLISVQIDHSKKSVSLDYAQIGKREKFGKTRERNIDATDLISVLRRLIIAFASTAILFFFLYQTKIISTPVQSATGAISDSVNIVKGMYYTPETDTARERFFEMNGRYQSDKELLAQWIFDIDSVWSTASRTCMKLIFLVVYCILIASLTAGVTLAIELSLMKNENPGGKNVTISSPPSTQTNPAYPPPTKRKF